MEGVDYSLPDLVEGISAELKSGIKCAIFSMKTSVDGVSRFQNW